MPKTKSRSSVKKRFRVTANKKIKHRHAFTSHILTKKSTKRKRTLRRAGITNVVQGAKILHMLGQ